MYKQQQHIHTMSRQNLQKRWNGEVDLMNLTCQPGICCLAGKQLSTCVKQDLCLLRTVCLTASKMFSSNRHVCFGAVISSFSFSPSFSPSQNELITCSTTGVFSICLRAFCLLFPPPVPQPLFLFYLAILCAPETDQELLPLKNSL